MQPGELKLKLLLGVIHPRLDSVGRDREQCGNVFVGQVLKECQAQNFLMLGSQGLQRPLCDERRLLPVDAIRRRFLRSGKVRGCLDPDLAMMTSQASQGIKRFVAGNPEDPE